MNRQRKAILVAVGLTAVAAWLPWASLPSLGWVGRSAFDTGYVWALCAPAAVAALLGERRRPVAGWPLRWMVLAPGVLLLAWTAAAVADLAMPREAGWGEPRLTAPAVLPGPGPWVLLATGISWVRIAGAAPEDGRSAGARIAPLGLAAGAVGIGALVGLLIPAPGLVAMDSALRFMLADCLPAFVLLTRARSGAAAVPARGLTLLLLGAGGVVLLLLAPPGLEAAVLALTSALGALVLLFVRRTAPGAAEVPAPTNGRRLARYTSLAVLVAALLVVGQLAAPVIGRASALRSARALCRSVPTGTSVTEFMTAARLLDVDHFSSRTGADRSVASARKSASFFRASCIVNFADGRIRSKMVGVLD